MNIHILGPTSILPYIYMKYKDKKSDNEFIVFSDSHFKFLDNEGFNVIKANYNPNHIYNPFDILKGLLFFKKHIFNKKKYTDINIYNVSYTMVTFLLLRLASLKNLLPVMILTDDVSRDEPIKSSKYLLFKPFGLDVEIVKYGNSWYPRLTTEYIFTYFFVDTIKENYIYQNQFETDTDTIFVLDDLPKLGLVKEYDFKQLINKTTSIIIHNNNSLAKKWHPETPANRKAILDENLEGKNMPSIIPFELMLSDKIKNVVGINSTCLIHAAKQDINTISLIDCIDYSDSHTIKWWLKRESGYKIKFISDINDLGGMLIV